MMLKICSVAVLCMLCFSLHAQTLESPLIPDYGKIWDVPNAIKPDSSLVYKIAIDLKTRVSEPQKVNRGLDNVARMINLHAVGGINSENIKVAVAVHGGATSIILNNDGYRQKHGVDNPNIELIKQLKAAGVELYVCSQSMLFRGYEMEHVNKQVDVGLSMLTVVSEKMMNGYELLVFE
ncbi:MAG: DsrE family protein [Cyclobacteriaceae bacterium]